MNISTDGITASALLGSQSVLGKLVGFAGGLDVGDEGQMSQWRFQRFWPQLLKSGAAGRAGARGESVHRAVIHTAGLSVGGEKAGCVSPALPSVPQLGSWRDSKGSQKRAVRGVEGEQRAVHRPSGGSRKKTDPWMWHLRSLVTSVRELLMDC